MKQAWQIPAAVGATAVLTFAGVSALQASANGPIRALGVSFQSHATPSPSAVVLGQPSSAPAGAGAPDGAVYSADELLAQAIWHLPPAQSAEQAPTADRPPLMPRRVRSAGLSESGAGPGTGGPGPDLDHSVPVGSSDDLVPQAAAGEPGQGGGRHRAESGPEADAGSGGAAPESAPAAEAVANAAEAPRLPAAQGPGPAVVASQSGFTAWGTSRKWAEEALRTAASEAAQAVHVGNGLGRAVGQQGGKPGKGGS